MPKGQQRGNKEAKKAKKAPAPAPIPAAAAQPGPASQAGAPRGPRK
jgi:hypothetical protein